ncbi:MAG TPA: SiaB family protein kinase [Flavobacteriales bacterium]
MLLEKVKYYFELMLKQHPAFAYRGAFEDYFTGIVLEMAETRAVNHPQDNTFNRKVAYMLVECFQNLIKHGENPEGSLGSELDEGLFCFKNFSNGFVINSINLIKEEQVARLEEMVRQVNSMSGDALKSYYLERLEKNRLSNKGGAGLGLIELARKSGHKILCKTEEMGNGLYRFHQQVTLKAPHEVDGHDFSSELEASHEIYNEMISSQIRLIFKGDVSNKSLLPILDFLKANTNRSSAVNKHLTRAGHVLIELSQNITKHGFGREYGNAGLLMVGEKDKRTVVYAGNVIGLSEKIILEQKLSYLRSLEHEELSELHKRTMRATLMFENKYNSGLGLIEIAKAASEPLSFDFFALDRDRYLFAMAVII